MREGYEVYEAYIDGHEKEVANGQAFTLEVRDLSDFSRKVVNAQVSKDPKALPGGQKLWFRPYKDDTVIGPWAIKILEFLDDDEVQPVRGDIARGVQPHMDKIY